MALLPTLYFIIGSIVKYNFGFSSSFSALDWFQQTPERSMYFNIISPFVFLGGLLLALVLNLIVPLYKRRTTRFDATGSTRLLKANLIVVAISSLLLFTLLLYVIAENLG
jgi:hypothetical protein